MSDVQHVWADLMVAACMRHGVTQFYLAPGSRSTPLVMAVARQAKVNKTIHFDERGTAFAALGYVRATRRPAAWITTSGTALANGFPAIVEAATDSVPMLLLTADRPPELRDTGSNQTINQPHLFGEYIRWHFDLPVPDPAINPQMVLTTVAQAIHRAQMAPQGPVHLNCMFREPLAPTKPVIPISIPETLADWTAQEAPLTTYPQPILTPDPAAVEALVKQSQNAQHGVVVAGRLRTRAEAQAVTDLAASLGWPLWPDVGSQCRLGAVPNTVAYVDVLLENPAFRTAHPVDMVLQFGDRLTSKRLRNFLADQQPACYTVIHPTPFRLDPHHQVSHRFNTNIEAFCTAFKPHVAASNAVVSTEIAPAQEAVENLLADVLETERLSEPLIARVLSQEIPETHGLFLASSRPVRDMDTFAVPDGAWVPVAANRGASGIDGTIASAVGFAQGLARPVTVLVGDLAFLHDLNALALLSKINQPIVLVVINNDGGGIFSFLPIAQHTAVFEPFFATPHGLTFEAAATLFGLDYAQPDTVSAFKTAYRAACQRPTSTLLEVRTDRRENHALHVQIREAINKLTWLR